MWQTAEIPAPVTKFAIRLSENGPHHSWVADHLGSLQSLSFQHLTVINICRTMHPFDSSFDDVTTLQPITDGLVAALRQARGLESLECDWWSWRQEHLKPILESCAKLQVRLDRLLGASCSHSGRTRSSVSLSTARSPSCFVLLRSSPLHRCCGSFMSTFRELSSRCGRPLLEDFR